MFKTLKNVILGLNPSYYFRNLFFGVLMSGFLIFVEISSAKAAGDAPALKEVIILSIINTILYPYARYVYERIVDFILGDNVIYINLIFALLFKIFTMFLCWGLAIFIFPIGLIFIFLHQYKESKEDRYIDE